jgi:hypothetical protein
MISMRNQISRVCRAHSVSRTRVDACVCAHVGMGACTCSSTKLFSPVHFRNCHKIKMQGHRLSLFGFLQPLICSARLQFTECYKWGEQPAASEPGFSHSAQCSETPLKSHCSASSFLPVQSCVCGADGKAWSTTHLCLTAFKLIYFFVVLELQPRASCILCK